MHFHSKMDRPRGTYDVIFRNHSNWPCVFCPSQVTKPSAQIGFIRFVLIPLFEALEQLFPVMEVLNTHLYKFFSTVTYKIWGQLCDGLTWSTYQNLCLFKKTITITKSCNHTVVHNVLIAVEFFFNTPIQWYYLSKPGDPLKYFFAWLSFETLLLPDLEMCIIC